MFHVCLQQSLLSQSVGEAGDRHIGEHFEFVEYHSMLPFQGLLVGGFQELLVRWQGRPAGVVDQVKREA
jgi:hypothetical protein